MRTIRGKRWFVGVALVAAMALAACESDRAGVDKAGGDTVTLRVGAVENPGVPYAPHVKEFARQVEELSGGTVRVEIVWDAAIEFTGEYGPRADQDVAGVVQRGELDMALVPARAWDELGVTSLQALQAPFLVTDDRLVEEIAQGEIGRQMLAGLEGAGVVGLALLPESLRHPVGFGGPLRTLEDFAGATVRAYLSKASYRLLESIGARPVNLVGDEFHQAVAAGKVDAAEWGFIWVDSMPELGTFTGNVTFFPKVNALVVNQEAFDALSEEQRATLQEAATNTLTHVIDGNATDAESAQAYCEAGGTIVLATQDDLAAFEQAALPVYDVLEADAQTAAFIEQIRTMKADVVAPAPVVETCGPAGEAAPDGSGTTMTFPEGVYRKEVAYPGGPWPEPDTDQLTFEDGTWSDVFPADPDSRCEGTYEVDGNRVVLTMTTISCGAAPEGSFFFSARWKLQGDQLQFLDLCCEPDPQNLLELAWGGEPWTKIS